MCHHYPGKQRRDAMGEAVPEFFEPTRLPDFSEWLQPVQAYPTTQVATMRIANHEWVLENRSWGLLPSRWKPTAKVKTAKAMQRGKFNARSETIDSTWPWKLVYRQRCVMLAAGFCEPAKAGGEMLYTLPEHDLFAIAGLYDRYTGDNGKGENVEVESVVMLTTEANELVASTRKGPRFRQPVILTDEQHVIQYCSPESNHDDLKALFSPIDAAAMQHELVS